MKPTEKTDEWDKYRQEHPCRYLIFWWTFGGLAVSGFLFLFVTITTYLLLLFSVVYPDTPMSDWYKFSELIFNMFQVNLCTFIIGLMIAFSYKEKTPRCCTVRVILWKGIVNQ